MSGGPRRAQTRHPIAWAIWTAAVPTPLPAAWTSTRSPGASRPWVSKASWAVINASGTAAASTKSRLAGIGTAIRSCVKTILGLATAGHDAEDAVARLERADHVRPQRIDLAGIFRAREYRPVRRAARDTLPRHCIRSARFKPQARTRTRTWSPLGSGVGTSRICRTSGPPVPVITMAFIAAHDRERPRLTGTSRCHRRAAVILIDWGGDVKARNFDSQNRLTVRSPMNRKRVTNGPAKAIFVPSCSYGSLAQSRPSSWPMKSGSGSWISTRA